MRIITRPSSFRFYERYHWFISGVDFDDDESPTGPWVSSFQVWRFRVNSGQFSALNGHSWSPLCALLGLFTAHIALHCSQEVHISDNFLNGNSWRPHICSMHSVFLYSPHAMDNTLQSSRLHWTTLDALSRNGRGWKSCKLKSTNHHHNLS